MKNLKWTKGAIDCLKDLIAFDTTSNRSNLNLISFIAEYLDGLQLKPHLTFNADKTKANLWATVPGRNTQDGGIVLSGHTDVVPVDNQVWDTNPFSATERDGKIYGRGAADMKGFIATVLANLPAFKALHLPHPIHLAFSFDEEVGCLGAPLMIADLKRLNLQPAVCVVGEPTHMLPVMSHKGIQVFKCHFRGKAVHSSLTPKGCNAIEYAARFIHFLRSLAEEMKLKGPFDEAFDVPFTSLSTNTIHGGNAFNIVPSDCEVHFEFRHLPQVAAGDLIIKIQNFLDEELLPSMQLESAEAEITMHCVGQVPSFEASETEDLYQCAKKICETEKVSKVAYATEAGFFQAVGISTIVCGPGSIEEAHRPNEFVTIQQLVLCEKFLLEMVKQAWMPK